MFDLNASLRRMSIPRKTIFSNLVDFENYQDLGVFILNVQVRSESKVVSLSKTHFIEAFTILRTFADIYTTNKISPLMAKCR